MHYGHQPRCVKCGNDHETKLCTKTKKEKSTRCNCKGDHTANYRGCLFYTDLVKQRNANSRNPSTQPKIPADNTKPQILPPTTTLQLPTPTTEKLSYAEIIENSSPATTKPSISAIKILEIIKNLLLWIQNYQDPITKDLIINTIMAIISEFLSPQHK